MEFKLGEKEVGKCWKGMREITDIPKHIKTKPKIKHNSKGKEHRDGSQKINSDFKL